MPVSYEWDVETVDPDSGDILDHDHRDNLQEVEKIGENEQLVLVRDLWSELDGVLDRQWAYPENGEFPDFFQTSDETDGAKVPARFKKEFQKNKDRLGL